MLRFISDLFDPILSYIKDDPVRPEIPLDFRVSESSEVLVLEDNGLLKAIVCVAYRDFVPKNVEELMEKPTTPNIAVFYTIWSYTPGAGRDLIIEARNELPKRRPNINKFVTLSPQTEMARKFHLKNGANIYRANSDSVNYEYA